MKDLVKGENYFMRVIEQAKANFQGLGGSRRVAKRRWILPIGIGGRHTTQAYYEIEGDMIGLTSREDLERWKANLYMRKTSSTVDFEGLGLRRARRA